MVPTANPLLQLISHVLWLLVLFSSCHGQVQLRAEYLEAKIPEATSHSFTAFYDGDDSIYLCARSYSFDSRILQFSISSETIAVIGSLPDRIFQGSMEADDSGNIYFFSGGQDYNQVYKYDPVLNRSWVVEPGNSPYYHTSFKVNSTTVLLLGGYEEFQAKTFNLKTESFSTLAAPLTFGLSQATSIHLEDKAFVFDSTHTRANRQALQLNLQTMEMSPVGPPSLPIFNYSPSSVYDGHFIYILGGYFPNEGHRTDGIIQLDSTTLQNVFIPIPNLPIANQTNFNYFLYGPASVFVPSLNRIYCFGGESLHNGNFMNWDDIWYLDLSTLPPPTTTTTESPSTTLNPDLFSCSNRTDGMYAHPTDCAKFIGCQDEEMEIFSCPPPLLFDPVEKSCNLPDLVNCDLSCVDRPDGLHPHPQDCALFIICDGGATTVFPCPPPLLFDPERLTCDYPSEVTCN